jgi:hypothetical protein
MLTAELLTMNSSQFIQECITNAHIIQSQTEEELQMWNSRNVQ